MELDEIFHKGSDTVIMDTGNVNDLQIYQACNIRVPKGKDYVPIAVTNLRKIRDTCVSAKKEKPPLAELFLSIAFFLLGVLLEALIMQIPYESTWLSIISYTICPAGFVGCIVAYCHLKRTNKYDINNLSDITLDYISDALEEIDNNEHE